MTEEEVEELFKGIEHALEQAIVPLVDRIKALEARQGDIDEKSVTNLMRGASGH